MWLFYSLFIVMFELTAMGLYLILPHWGISDTHVYVHSFGRSLLYTLPFIAAIYYSLIVLGRSRTALLTTETVGETAGETAATQVVFHPVDRWVRIAIRLIDMLFVLLGLVMIFPVVRFWLGMTNLAIFLKFESLAAADFLFGIILLLYYFVMDMSLATTFGKMIINVLIVNETGQRPSVGQIIGRNFSRLIPFDAFSFLFRDRGWHDSIPGTYVVRGKYEWEGDGPID